MHFFTKVFAIVSIASATLASLLMERQCIGIFEPCTGSEYTCCQGLTCSAGIPYGSCMPTPGVCGAAGDQCSTEIPTDICCEGLTCSGLDGFCQ
ncbi:hypothetical protein J3R30DRAFT_2674995 [Lentinula aciculospora]|uniref:Uncharacterized protein n=1 Tax=Lentinula aciculospora TaxID=153920 RepID=A0A9W9DDW6_9AGAR|nr:hypothetical protein J3R30DRAFT_2674995 [Lentinula aciculospora]